MALYLLGIFMGAIDTGIVTPARTLIQTGLGVDEKTGIWMITAFTLAYACSMPIMGKLADRLGRKSVYIVSIVLFGAGSLICGLSQNTGSFPLLIAGRVVQALGGGGIVPLANAEFGTSFPPEKRGIALGLVGGVYGIANIMGSTLGSAILDVVGTQNWQWIFYINLPISVFIVIFGIGFLPKREKAPTSRMDLLGITVLVTMVSCLLYGLGNLDFFHFADSITDTDVYPFLIAFAALLPVFILVERKAEDPVLNLDYFRRRNTVVIFVLSTIVGIFMMGMVFVPQFAENGLRLPTGKGGYFVTILGVFAGIAAPLSGTLIDRLGAKKVLFAGFAISLAGALFLAFVASRFIGTATVVISLVLIGLGMGFTIGTPLNYMMLASTRKEESNSALAALSLMRSIGTSIGPMLMVGFIAQAGIAAQDDLMNALPPVSSIEIKADQTRIDAVKALLGQEKANAEQANADTAALGLHLDTLAALNDELSKATAAREAAYAAVLNDPAFKDMLQKMQMPEMPGGQSLDIADIRKQLLQNGSFDTSELDKQAAKLDDAASPSMDFDMGSGGSLPDDVVKDLQSADVTNIVDKTVHLVNRLFEDKTPGVMKDIQDGMREGEDGVQQGIDGIAEGIGGLSTGIDGIQSGISGISEGVGGIDKGLAGMDEGLGEMTKARSDMLKGVRSMKSGIAGIQKGLKGIGSGIDGMRQGLAQQNEAIASMQQTLDMLIANSGDPAQIMAMKGQLAGITSARDQLQAKLDASLAQQKAMKKQLSSLTAQKKKLEKAVATMDKAKVKLQALRDSTAAEQAVLKKMLAEMKQCHGLMTSTNTLMAQTKGQMSQTKELLAEMRAAIPSQFDDARQAYNAAVIERSETIKQTFQSAINNGFKQIYITTAALCLAALIILLLYKESAKRRKSSAGVTSETAANP